MKMMLTRGLFAWILSGLMSWAIAGVSTYRTLGWSTDFIGRWTNNWLAGWMVAFPLVLVIAPLARRLATLLLHGRADMLLNSKHEDCQQCSEAPRRGIRHRRK